MQTHDSRPKLQNFTQKVRNNLKISTGLSQRSLNSTQGANLPRFSRVEDYINIYQKKGNHPRALSSRNHLKLNSPAGRRSTTNTARSNINPSRMTTVSNLKPSIVNIAPSKGTVDRLKMMVLKAKYDVSKAKSDKIELIRDISTYEYCMGMELDVVYQLQSLTDITYQLPDNCNYLIDYKAVYQQQFTKLKQSMETLQNIELQPTLPPSVKPPITENMSVIQKSATENLATIFQGIRKLSSIRSVINIKGNKWAEDLRITAYIPDHRYPLHYHLKLQMSNITSMEAIKRLINKRILPSLYLSYTSMGYKLKYEEGNGKKFVRLILDIKGLGRRNVKVTEEEGMVQVQVDGEEELSVNLPLKALSGRLNLYKEDSLILGRRIECKIF